MVKTFTMENDVGIDVNYTILGVSKNNEDRYVVYTNYMPSDNEFGFRLLASKLVSEEPFIVERITRAKEKEIIEFFKLDFANALGRNK